VKDEYLVVSARGTGLNESDSERAKVLKSAVAPVTNPVKGRVFAAYAETVVIR